MFREISAFLVHSRFIPTRRCKDRVLLSSKVFGLPFSFHGWFDLYFISWRAHSLNNHCNCSLRTCPLPLYNCRCFRCISTPLSLCTHRKAKRTSAVGRASRRIPGQTNDPPRRSRLPFHALVSPGCHPKPRPNPPSPSAPYH